MGLDMGADDYIVKPFSPGEAMARIRAIMRRVEIDSQHADKDKVITLDNLTMSLDDFTVTIDRKPLALTKKEFDILWTLVSNQNKVFSRNHLLNSLWGYDYFGDNRTVDTHVKRLRAKLEPYNHPSWDIKTIWGVGYKCEVLVNEK